MEIPVRKDLLVALTLATLVSSQALLGAANTATAAELTGTLAKVKELGYITDRKSVV